MSSKFNGSGQGPIPQPGWLQSPRPRPQPSWLSGKPSPVAVQGSAGQAAAASQPSQARAGDQQAIDVADQAISDLTNIQRAQAQQSPLE